MKNRVSRNRERDFLIGSDTLVDSVGLVQAAAIASAAGGRVLVPQLDYYYLMLLYGGYTLDEDGVASIDIDIRHLDEAIWESERTASVKEAERSSVTLVEDTAPLALLRVLQERRLLEILPYTSGTYGGRYGLRMHRRS